MATEARDRGDRREARKFSTVARDIQARVSAGDTSIEFYDTQTGRIQHSEAGSDTHVAYVSGESPRFVPVDREQIREIRAFHREQEQVERPLIIPQQTIRGPSGDILYTISPGDTPGTAFLTVPSTPGEPAPSAKWTVTYDLGKGERAKSFDTEQEATTFRDTLVTRETARVDVERERQFTLVGEQTANFIAYLNSIGPFEPTEEQKLRLDAGIPLRGIPGPALTKPGSIEEKLESFAVDVLAKTEAPFKAITDPLRNVEKVFEKLSHDVFKTEIALQPSVLLGAQTVPIVDFDSVIKVPTAQKPVVGTAAYLASVGIGVLATGIDVATFEIRPGLQKEVVAGVAGLVFDPDVRAATAAGVIADPFRFVANLIGGATVGQQIQLSISKANSDIVKLVAKRSFDKLTADNQALFAKFERGLNLDFPEEVILPEVLEVFRPETIFEADTTFNIKFGKMKEVLIDEPLAIQGEFGIKPTRGSIKTPFSKTFGRTGADLVPMIVPEEFTVPKTVWRFQRTLLNIPSGRAAIPIIMPGVDLSSTILNAAKASVPSITSSLSISAMLSIDTSLKFEQQIKDITKSLLVTPQALKKIVDVTQIQIQDPKPIQVQVQMPKPIQIQIPTPTQIQEPFQIQIQKPFQVTIQDPFQITIQEPFQIQIQEPFKTPPPTIIIPKIIPPPKPPIPIIKVLRKKKKKKIKKPGKPKKGIFELRIDTIVSKLLKELKL